MDFDRALAESRAALRKLRQAEKRIAADADLTEDAKRRKMDEAPTLHWRHCRNQVDGCHCA